MVRVYCPRHRGEFWGDAQRARLLDYRYLCPQCKVEEARAEQERDQRRAEWLAFFVGLLGNPISSGE